MTLPIAPVTLPSDLAGQANGRLAPGLLRAVPGGGQLHHLAARAFAALADAAMVNASMGLTYTYGGCYRTYSQQETLFRSRYAVGGPGGGCKGWNGQTWCKKSSNLATAATPGTSNHGLGLAIDTAYDSDLSDGVGPDDAAAVTAHPGWPWLLANAHRFGFSWELQSEPWHIRYVTGDAIPAAVLEWETFRDGTNHDPEEDDMAHLIAYIAKPPAERPGAPWLVVIDGAVRYAASTDAQVLTDHRVLNTEQYDYMRKCAGV